MAKFRVRLKLQALELEIDGEREDMPAITSAVQQQLAGLVKPAEAFADGRKQLEIDGQVPDAGIASKDGQRSNHRRRGKVPVEGGQPIGYRHDHSTYGSPLQKWTVLQKAIWQLEVLNGSDGKNEVGCSQLAATFNQQFKSAGTLRPSHVSRALKKGKGLNPAPVSEDKDLWYLTEEGHRQARDLIQTIVKPS